MIMLEAVASLTLPMVYDTSGQQPGLRPQLTRVHGIGRPTVDRQ
jgi:hypothetical protein